MKNKTVQVENLKCHGCASTIKKGLLKFDEVNNVDVDIQKSEITISFEGKDSLIKDYEAKLLQMGYPEKGNNKIKSIAKSFVSCAIGRVNQ